MVSPLIGQGIALATKLIPNFRTWFMENLDSGQTLQGQFSPTQTVGDVNTVWAQHTALNRGNSILQFVNCENDVMSFQGRFFREAVTDSDPEEKLKTLMSWAKIDKSVRRPPVIHFYVGDGHASMDVVIQRIGNISYGRATALGQLRDVTFNVEMLQFTSFSLDEEGETDTRYARAKGRDYYEMLAQQEYGNPLLGDYIRKQHPSQPLLADGNVVKLPSIEGVRTKKVTQTSVALKTAFGHRPTPQRALRLRFIELRGGSKISHIFQ